MKILKDLKMKAWFKKYNLNFFFLLFISTDIKLLCQVAIKFLNTNFQFEYLYLDGLAPNSW